MGAPGALAAAAAWLEAQGLPPHAQRRLLWASLGGLCLLYAARRLAGPSRKRPARSTDFNGFLAENVPAQPRRAAAKRSPPSTDFNAFLRERRAAPAKTDFNAFLRDLFVGEGEAEAAPAEAAVGPREDQVAVTVLFGTEFGFAKEIAEKLAGMLGEAAGGRFWPRLLDMAAVPSGFDAPQEQALLVVCSTQGDGVPPSEARDFCDWLGSSSAPQLPDTRFSVCALGDTSYTHFCACGKQLDARLEALGGSRLAPRTDVNREDWAAVNAWLAAVLQQLQALKLQTVGESGYAAGEAGAEPEGRVSKARPLLAAVEAVEGLCRVRSAADKDTVRVELSLGGSGLSYAPGDALGIHARNAPEAVQELLACLGSSGSERLPLPSWHYADPERPAGSEAPLRELLERCYDLRVPKPELLQALWEALPPEPRSDGGPPANGNGTHANGSADHANGGKAQPANGHVQVSLVPASAKNGARKGGLQQQRRALQALLAGPEAAREAYLEPRHVTDVLRDFPAARLATRQLLAGLRALQPRLYSISSSPLEAADRVQVTVATVRYASLGRERLGVASTFLAERIQVGERLPVYVAKNPDFRLPPSPATPIIMVGPGTGLAPFRAFMQQRLLGGEPFGPCLLFFGCRRRDQDFLYGRQLEAWAAAGSLELHTAFSREQERKVYVQDRLRQAGARVWQLLQAGAHFYVCGDASRMAADVERALLDVLRQHQDDSQEAAETYLEQLRRSDRYQRDVWY